ncbi:MAG: hypothetical protein RQ885_14145 [Desulfurococcales archaeon]|jgi:translin|nr:hypothetical protein [Desulfurococcales archaeon]
MIGDVGKKILEEIDRISGELDRRDALREEILNISRELIRCSGRAVTYINAGDLQRTREEIYRCSSLVKKLLEVPDMDRDLTRYGLSLQAFAEFCEASYLYMIVSRDTEEIARLCSEKIPPEARLLAIEDLTGELRRHAITLLTEWKVDESITIVRLISEIYSRLRYLDYPDSLVPGFKHKVDVMRRALEDLETLLVDVKSRRELISEIGSLKEKLRT